MKISLMSKLQIQNSLNRSSRYLCSCVFICGFVFLLVVTAFSQIPSPRSVLGFTPGDDRTIADWHQITDYFTRLDKASNRVLVQKIGESTLKRPVVVAFISAPENILALNKYEEIQRRLSDPRLVSGERERGSLV